MTLIKPDPFRTFGRKKGNLSPKAEARLQEQLPLYQWPICQQREALFQQLGVDFEQSRLVLEIGFGNGQFLATMAAHYPQDQFVGVDVFKEGVFALLRRLEREHLNNVRVVPKSAQEMLSMCIPPKSLDWVIINFPDPWPKKRHHKRRLVQADFLDLLATRMRVGGLLTLATDLSEYAQWMLAVLESHIQFKNRHNPGMFAPEPSIWIQTNFQKKGLLAGREIYHLAYQKIKVENPK